MRMVSTSLDNDQQLEELHLLTVLLEQALSDTNELHHRIREIQLRLAGLSASIERGRGASTSQTGGHPPTRA